MAAKRADQTSVVLQEIKDGALEKRLVEREAELAQVKAQLSGARRDLTISQREQHQLRELLDMVEKIGVAHKKQPAWLAVPKKPRQHTGTVCLMLSDLHLDEVVNPAEVEGLNSYNREIAGQRLKRVAEKTIMLADQYVTGLKYDGITLFMPGDNVSGYIHEELVETNAGTLPETVEYWLNPLSALISTLVDHFGNIHCACTVGNHGRLTKKPRSKKRATDNIDWLIYRLLARDFRDDKRVSFDIPYSADTTVEVYNTSFLLTHGDQFRGGSGISGVLAPLMTGAYRKAKRAMQVDKSWDHLVMGHWHQYGAFKNIIVNGSTKGYDEYAYTSNFEFEPPQQAFWITTPEHGVTFSAPVRVMDRKAEGW